MGIEEQYAREVRNPLIDSQIEQAQRGVHRGSIKDVRGSFYQRDDDEPVLSVNTITASPGDGSDGSDLPPEYRRARGVVMHDDRDGLHSEDLGGLFREEFDGHWLSTWRAVAEDDPTVSPPEEVDFDRFDRFEEAKRIVSLAAVDQAQNASMLASMWWTDVVDYTPLANEMVFVTNVDGTRFGGQIDRLVRIDDGLPEGLYAADYKLTHEIQNSHYQQVEAFRRAFWPDMGPIDGLILRVDPIKREVESVSTHDEEWPDDAWDEFRVNAREEYGRDLIRLRMRQSVWH
ncbi:hypothetical protein NDI85_06080 [Halomicroarcula sp. S1AR25-4]|uniref:hypothetical protein n=1 Tax=Haloarcula sp. S1AR25-4 TaxID=2950538 RepID=UPI002875A207|nr:hypothetical protein [Halomicroarcula sp. S1AR25-4]MDS0277354.1 hypothetical protein [Halomicroarcula sp. S1AR25-4]